MRLVCELVLWCKDPEGREKVD